MNTPVIPIIPDCGAPCAVCEAYAHRVSQLEGAIALGQHNCDETYQDLRDERDTAKAEAARLRRVAQLVGDAVEAGAIEECYLSLLRDAVAALSDGGNP